MNTLAPVIPPPQRRRTARDLARADWLRPRDIFEIYGIPASTLGDLANHPDETRRPPSRFIRGRGGRRGIRIFRKVDFAAWIERWTAAGEFTKAPKKAA